MEEILAFLNQRILAFPFYLSFIVLLIVLISQFFSPALLKRHISRVFLYTTGLIFAYFIYIAFLQFRAFQAGPLALTLGKEGALSWFLGYVRLHYWNDYLVSLPVAIFFALIAYYFNKKYKERFFEEEELFVIALSILLVGYPGFLFYLPLALLVPAVISAIFVKRGERLPLYHFWISTAIVVLLVIHFWAASQSWWASFRF